MKHIRLKSLTVAMMMVAGGGLSVMQASTSDSLRLGGKTGWYGGVDGGPSLGYSTFSSSGHDKVRTGWSVGVFGGYRFNKVLSAEVSVRHGWMTMTGKDCCVRREYWLGSDGGWHGAPVLGQDCWNYRDLKSRVSVGQYGLRFNVNVLSFFGAPVLNRWSLDISPVAYAVSSKATIKTLFGSHTVLRRNTRWHFGGGFSVQPAYQVNELLKVGVYSGFTFLTGNRMDGMPKHLHINNAIWDSGVKVTFNIGRKPRGEVNREQSPAPVVVCPEETGKQSN